MWLDGWIGQRMHKARETRADRWITEIKREIVYLAARDGALRVENGELLLDRDAKYKRS